MFPSTSSSRYASFFPFSFEFNQPRVAVDWKYSTAVYLYTSLQKLIDGVPTGAAEMVPVVFLSPDCRFCTSGSIFIFEDFVVDQDPDEVEIVIIELVLDIF